MKFLVFILLWLLLAAVCWPIALLAVLLLPILWIVALPFRLVFHVTEALFALVRAILFLPSRLLGGGRS